MIFQVKKVRPILYVCRIIDILPMNLELKSKHTYSFKYTLNTTHLDWFLLINLAWENTVYFVSIKAECVPRLKSYTPVQIFTPRLPALDYCIRGVYIYIYMFLYSMYYGVIYVLKKHFYARHKSWKIWFMNKLFKLYLISMRMRMDVTL